MSDILAPMTTHVARGVSRLMSTLKKKPNFVAFVTAFLQEVQELEDAVQQLADFTGLANAYGYTLDLWGKRLNLARGGMMDAIYRVRLQVKQLLDRSHGTVPEILAMFQLLVLPPRTLTLLDQYPKAFELFVGGAATTDQDGLLDVLREAHNGGTRALLHYLVDAPSKSFTVAGGVGLGLQLTTDPPGTGGVISRMVE